MFISTIYLPQCVDVTLTGYTGDVAGSISTILKKYIESKLYLYDYNVGAIGRIIHFDDSVNSKLILLFMILIVSQQHSTCKFQLERTSSKTFHTHTIFSLRYYMYIFEIMEICRTFEWTAYIIMNAKEETLSAVQYLLKGLLEVISKVSGYKMRVL